MTRDEIIRMAREAGFQTGCLYPQNGKGEPTLLVCALGTSCTVEVEKLIRAAYAAGAAAVYKDENMFTEAYAGGYAAGAAAEREACAKVCESEAMRCEAAVERAEPDEVAAIRSTAWKISVCAAAIRARGEK